MWAAEQVIAGLRASGDLWESVPGAIGLRGDTLRLYRAIEARISEHALESAADEWLPPAVVSFETLARADYFSCFPQWLTVASHLRDDRMLLEHVADAADPVQAARAALAPAAAALPPAVCYNVYAALRNHTIASDVLVTVQGCCWRHEGHRLTPLERGWAFTMREVVCVGSAPRVEQFRTHEMRRAIALANSLGLRGELQQASDPFFAAAGRGKEILQRVKALKHELHLPIGGGNTVAAASFNNHEHFFGDAFSITRADRTAATGCAAFGIERWLLAYLVAHGPAAVAWPILELEGVTV